MADKVKFYRSTAAKIKAHPIENGAVYFATDTPESWMDVNGERIPMFQPDEATWEDFPTA